MMYEYGQLYNLYCATLANLTACQARCTELLEENRALRTKNTARSILDGTIIHYIGEPPACGD